MSLPHRWKHDRPTHTILFGMIFFPELISLYSLIHNGSFVAIKPGTDSLYDYHLFEVEQRELLLLTEKPTHILTSTTHTNLAQKLLSANTITMKRHQGKGVYTKR